MKLDETPTTTILDEIQRLQADRQKHVDALNRIDDVLKKIASTLAVTPIGEIPSDAARRVNTTSAASRDAAADARRKYNKLPLTGEQFILAYVREHGTATTLEINAAWRQQGRGGVANNALGRLVKQGLLTREPLNDQRGSRYRVSGRSTTHAA